MSIYKYIYIDIYIDRYNTAKFPCELYFAVLYIYIDIYRYLYLYISIHLYIYIKLQSPPVRSSVLVVPAVLCWELCPHEGPGTESRCQRRGGEERRWWPFAPDWPVHPRGRWPPSSWGSRCALSWRCSGRWSSWPSPGCAACVSAGPAGPRCAAPGPASSWRRRSEPRWSPRCCTGSRRRGLLGDSCSRRWRCPWRGSGPCRACWWRRCRPLRRRPGRRPAPWGRAGIPASLKRNTGILFTGPHNPHPSSSESYNMLYLP